MNCPRCAKDTLVELDRGEVTIDRCERCRGVWLDRGELEKLLATAEPRRGRDGDDDDDDRDHRRGGRRSWWEIFD